MPCNPKMFISEQTVKNHLHNIFDKLGVSALMLQARELLDVATTLAAGRRLKNFFHRFDGTTSRRDRYGVQKLSEQASRITPLKHLEELVERLDRWGIHPDKTCTHRLPLAQAPEPIGLQLPGKPGRSASCSKGGGRSRPSPSA
jgi:hypothetical protein